MRRVSSAWIFCLSAFLVRWAEVKIISRAAELITSEALREETAIAASKALLRPRKSISAETSKRFLWRNRDRRWGRCRHLCRPARDIAGVITGRGHAQFYQTGIFQGEIEMIYNPAPAGINREKRCRSNRDNRADVMGESCIIFAGKIRGPFSTMIDAPGKASLAFPDFDFFRGPFDRTAIDIHADFVSRNAHRV